MASKRTTITITVADIRGLVLCELGQSVPNTIELRELRIWDGDGWIILPAELKDDDPLIEVTL